MESSVLVHECTLRNIDLVAVFFFFLLLAQILLLVVLNILSQFMQVVKISGLCKLSVFLIVMENSPHLSAVSGILC